MVDVFALEATGLCGIILKGNSPMKFRIISLVLAVIVTSSDGKVVAGSQAPVAFRRDGQSSTDDGKPMGDPTKDPLVNEQKMREILADEKTETTKKVRFLELYAYKRYPVSNELEPFLLEKMKDTKLTVSILRLFEETNRRFEVNEIVSFGQPYVDACVYGKRWKELDHYLYLLQQCTPPEGLSAGRVDFKGYDQQFDAYVNKLWEKSDDCFAYCLMEKGRQVFFPDIFPCAPQVFGERCRIVLGKIRPDGSGLTATVLAALGPSPDIEKGCFIYFPYCIQQSDIPTFVALLDNKDSQTAGYARRMLQMNIGLGLGIDPKSWLLAKGKEWSLSRHLRDIIKDKHCPGGDAGRVHAFTAVRIKTLRSAQEAETDYTKDYFENIVSSLLDQSESAKSRRGLFFDLTQIVKDHSLFAEDKTEWDGLLERCLAVLLKDQKDCMAVVSSLPSRMIKGEIREKIILGLRDKKMPPLDRSRIMGALGRGDKEYKNAEHIVEDARLALTVIGEIPGNDEIDPDFGKVTSAKDMVAFLKLDTEEARLKRIICMAMKDMTGRTDCGFDIAKWRQVVGEMEAKAMLGVDGGQ